MEAVQPPEEILGPNPQQLQPKRILKNEQRSLEKIEEKAEEVDREEKDDTIEDLKPASELKPMLQRRLSSQKSFEMEDIPDEKSKKKLPAGQRRLKSPRERKRASRPLPITSNPKYDYPIGKV